MERNSFFTTKRGVTLLGLLFSLAFSLPLFSNPAKQAAEYFNKAKELSEQNKNQEALDYYVKAFDTTPTNGFYAARVGQHYYTRLQDYSPALRYYLKSFSLGFRGEWMLSQMVNTLNRLSEFALADNNLEKALKYLSSAQEIIANTPGFDKRYMELTRKNLLLKNLSENQNTSPEYVHKILVILVQQVDYQKGPITIRTQMSPEEKKYSILSAKTLKTYIEALSGNKLSISLKIKEWNQPVSSLRVKNSKEFVLDTENLSRELDSLLTPEIEQTDTVIYFWPSGSMQNAHGGAGNFFLANNTKRAWRGIAQIPSFRMPYNGPWLVLHEFFHTVENMTSIKTRHGYYPDLRSQFPGWEGEGELDYYAWQFSQYIPEFINAKKFQSPGWHNMNFSQIYPIRILKQDK